MSLGQVVGMALLTVLVACPCAIVLALTLGRRYKNFKAILAAAAAIGLITAYLLVTTNPISLP